MTILDLTVEDFGTYLCIASNEYGTGKAAAELRREFVSMLMFFISSAWPCLENFESVTPPWYERNVIPERSVEGNDA